MPVVYRPESRHKRAKPILVDDGDALSLPNLARRYLAWCELHHFSSYTTEQRARMLHYFAEWAKERGVTRASEVSLPVIERYQRHLFHYRKEKDGRPLTIHSQRSRLAILRPFFKWLVRERYLLANPASELVIPRKITHLPKDILSAEEAERVLATPDVSNPIGVRDRAILETLYSTGIRRFELVELRLWNLDLQKGTVFVSQGKGKKDRVVPLGERAQAWVEKYLREVRAQLVVEPDEQVVFLTGLGTKYHPATLTQMARFYVRASGVKKKGACHLFRHTCATLMLEGGADIRYIQELLGHSDLETTEIYTQVSIGKLQQIHAATHPGARLKRRSEDQSDEDALLEAMVASFAAEASEEDDVADGER